ncbi:MAG: hypothetical protein ABIH25_05350 [Candidatus Woesearchaeota archaeon]
MEREVTSLEDLAKIVRNAPEFKHWEVYWDGMVAYRPPMEEISSEALEAEYEGNKVCIEWMWCGKLEDGKGFRDKFLRSINGLKRGKLEQGYTLYHPMFHDFMENPEIIEMALVAREKYLSQMKT